MNMREVSTPPNITKMYLAIVIPPLFLQLNWEKSNINSYLFSDTEGSIEIRLSSAIIKEEAPAMKSYSFLLSFWCERLKV